MPGSMKLGSMGLIPPTICLDTLSHPLFTHELHSTTIGVGVSATTASASAPTRRFLLLLPLLAALTCCLIVPCNLFLITLLLAVRQ